MSMIGLRLDEGLYPSPITKLKPVERVKPLSEQVDDLIKEVELYKDLAVFWKANCDRQTIAFRNMEKLWNDSGQKQYSQENIELKKALSRKDRQIGQLLRKINKLTKTICQI